MFMFNDYATDLSLSAFNTSSGSTNAENDSNVEYVVPNSIAMDGSGNEVGKIFVGGLSQSTHRDTLKSYFEFYGIVEDADVMMDAATGRSRGFGYVKFLDPTCVDLILNIKPHIIDGKEIEAKQSNVNMRGKSRRNLKVFVGGISVEHDEEYLRNFFSQYGEVTEVNLMMDAARPRHRGFAFIGFSSEAAVKTLIQMHFVTLGKRKVEIKAMEPPNYIEKYGRASDRANVSIIDGNKIANPTIIWPATNVQASPQLGWTTTNVPNNVWCATNPIVQGNYEASPQFSYIPVGYSSVQPTWTPYCQQVFSPPQTRMTNELTSPIPVSSPQVIYTSDYQLPVMSPCGKIDGMENDVTKSMQITSPTLNSTMDANRMVAISMDDEKKVMAAAGDFRQYAMMPLIINGGKPV